VVGLRGDRDDEESDKEGGKMQKTIAILGTLDTKGVEYSFLKECIEAEGVSTLVVDAGILGEPAFPPDISASEVAKAAGEDLNVLIRERDRGRAVAAMSKGAVAVIKNLYDGGKFQGIISLGGTSGTTIGTSAMQALPTGVPKLMVSTVASGDTRPYVGVKDITMMPSVVDVAGINRISVKILSNAAGAIAGMVKVQTKTAAEDKPLIAASMFGVTTPCVTKAKEILESAGYEVLVFHCTGVGGRSMEDLIKGGFIKGVLDITTSELTDELVGGIFSAGPHRLEAAGEAGIPQVVCPGAIDLVTFGPPDTVPAVFRNRRLHQHNPTATVVKTTIEENEQLGKIIAEKLNRAKGPTIFMMPMRGLSLIGTEGQPFYDTEADAAFLRGLKRNLSDKVRLIEMDTAINDEEFATKAANLLLEILEK
jgi:uncharacterized protein (UPF0261 family)